MKGKFTFLLKYGEVFEWSQECKEISIIIDRLTRIGAIQVYKDGSKKMISVTEKGTLLIEEIIGSYIFEKKHSVSSNFLTEVI